jgi:CheY-like chemotaxis protein
VRKPAANSNLSGEQRPLTDKDQAITDRAIPSRHAPSTSKPRVLVVDDNTDAAHSLGRLLSLLGQEVAVVHNGEAAVAEVARFRPHLVLLDLGMPGMDGIETAERIHTLPEAEKVLLVALTGWGHDRDRRRTEEAGFAAHLVKPVQMAQLEALLSRLPGPV